MTLPIEVQKLCNQYLDLLRQGHQTSLGFDQREALYQAFGLLQWWRGSRNNDEPLWLSEASRVVSWLSIITARKVIFVWEVQDTFPVEPEDFYRQLPHEVLKTTEEFLLGAITEREAVGELKGDFYYFPFDMHAHITWKVYCAMQASIAALETTLFGSANSFAGFDEFADYCIIAFAGLDSNMPGVWIDYSQIIQAGWEIATDEKWTEERTELVRQYQPVKNDPQKEVEFWEWWLNEAIPQAWEMATTKC